MQGREEGRSPIFADWGDKKEKSEFPPEDVHSVKLKKENVESSSISWETKFADFMVRLAYEDVCSAQSLKSPMMI